MATIVLNAREFAAFHGKLAHGFEAAAMRGVMAGAERARQFAIAGTRSAPPANPSGKGSGGAVNTGSFLRRWRVARTDHGVRLYNDHPAASTIERGRRPGRRPPPTAPIARWIQRRLGKSRAEAKGMAFLVARSIGRRGLLGRMIISSPGARREILRLVKTETVRELRRAIREGA